MESRSHLGRALGQYGGYGMAVLLMWLLKRHYSAASPQDLRWVLTPLAGLVQLLDGAPYLWNSDAGWVRSDGYIVIAPACAGVNFMIMVFGLNCMAFWHRLSNFRQQAAWLIAGLIAAYFLSLGVNTLRIFISILFYENQLHWGWFTPDRLHRMIGVGIYFSALGACYLLLDRIALKLNPLGSLAVDKKVSPPWQPLAWYLTGTLAVPLLHKLIGGDPRLNLEYSVTVIGVSSAVWLAGFIVYYLLKKDTLCDLSS